MQEHAIILSGTSDPFAMQSSVQILSYINPRMHNRGQNDSDGATHVDCLKQIANILLDFLDFVSNL